MTTRQAAARKSDLPLGAFVNGPHSPARWGMLLVIMNEAVLFASLLASYFYLRFNSVLWPPQGVGLPELTLSSANTILLLASSLVMIWAVNGIRLGQVRRLRIGLAIAFLMGAAFLGIQVYEYIQLRFLPWDHAYGSLFWGTTGIHAAHVLAALLVNAYVQVRAGFGHFSEHRYQAVDNLGLYWHFVDVVWLFIFAALFLSPYL